MFWTDEPELEARVVPTPVSSGKSKRSTLEHDALARILSRLHHTRATRMMVAWYRWVCAPAGPARRPHPVVLRRVVLRATRRYVSQAWRLWIRFDAMRWRLSASVSLIGGIARRQYLRHVSRGFSLLRSATSLQLVLRNARRRAVAAALCRRFTCLVFRAWIALRLNTTVTPTLEGVPKTPPRSRNAVVGASSGTLHVLRCGGTSPPTLGVR